MSFTHAGTHTSAYAPKPYAPGVKFLSQVRLFSFFFLLCILVQNIKSVTDHDALTSPFHTSISFINSLSWICIFFLKLSVQIHLV